MGAGAQNPDDASADDGRPPTLAALRQLERGVHHEREQHQAGELRTQVSTSSASGDA
ncbi:MAG: hypothetical protein XXXNARYT_001827 [Candidatus Accumulibacter regalis]|jgi:hypothetical protein